MCNQEIAKEDNNTTEICILSQEELKACPTKDLLKMMLKLSRICRKEEKEYGHLLKSGICAAAELYIIRNILENRRRINPSLPYSLTPKEREYYFTINPNNPDYIEAHKFCCHHREMLEKDNRCGCFNCLNIFNPSEIEEWLDCDIGHTALCPYCGIDSVIGESSGYPITKEFLKKMQDKWF